MSDLVERLRYHQPYGIMQQAAARIEALEAALRTIAEQRLVYDGDAGGNYELRFNHLVLSARAVLAALAPEQDKMSDLVERLRNRIHDAPMPTEHMLDEAADRIEALEAALRERDELIRLMRRSGSRKPNPQPNLRGSAALAPEQDKNDGVDRSDWPKDGFINDYD